MEHRDVSVRSVKKTFQTEYINKDKARNKKNYNKNYSKWSIGYNINNKKLGILCEM